METFRAFFLVFVVKFNTFKYQTSELHGGKTSQVYNIQTLEVYRGKK